MPTEHRQKRPGIRNVDSRLLKYSWRRKVAAQQRAGWRRVDGDVYAPLE